MDSFGVALPDLGPKYEVVRRLGAGGMGVVVEVAHRRTGQRLALKVLRGDRAKPSDMQRFLREARAAAAVRHPNVVSVYDVDQTPSGQWYIAMELVRGATLREVVASERPGVGEIIAWLLETCDALGAAHAAGVIHRDIKPENILVETSPERRARLTDFGISKILSESDTSDTVNSNVMGTPFYMSPEQVLSHPIDARTDIFSLGVVAYELIAGMRPFAASGGITYLAAVIAKLPRPLAETRPDLPAALSDAIASMLARDPKDRPQTMAEVRARLEEFKSLSERPTPKPTPRLEQGDEDAIATELVGATPASTSLPPLPIAHTGQRNVRWGIGIAILIAAASAGVSVIGKPASTPSPAAAVDVPVRASTPVLARTTDPIAPPRSEASASSTAAPLPRPIAATVTTARMGSARGGPTTAPTATTAPELIDRPLFLE